MLHPLSCDLDVASSVALKFNKIVPVWLLQSDLALQFRVPLFQWAEGIRELREQKSAPCHQPLRVDHQRAFDGISAPADILEYQPLVFAAGFECDVHFFDRAFKVMPHPLAGAYFNRGVEVEITMDHRKQRG